jgi:DNA modification methylase
MSVKDKYEIRVGNNLDLLKEMPDQSVNCVVTSPPYWGLRDYGTGEWEGGDEDCDHVANPNATKKFGNEEFNKNCPAREMTKTKGYYEDVCPKCGAVRTDNQLGQEDTPEEFAENLVELFREIRRVLKDDGTVWLNIGDTYGYPPKNLVGIPWRVAFALQDDGWILRQDIIWSKPNPMPESVKDRCTKAHEYIFLFAKNKKYYFDNKSIQEDARNWGTRDRTNGKYTSGHAPTLGGNHAGLVGKEWEENPKKNKRSVWTISTKPFKGAHFAVYPIKLIEPCILAGCPKGGVVLDPFSGSGTTGIVAINNGRNYIGLELNPEYAEMSLERIKDECPNTLEEFFV